MLIYLTAHLSSLTLSLLEWPKAATLLFVIKGEPLCRKGLNHHSFHFLKFYLKLYLFYFETGIQQLIASSFVRPMRQK